LEHTLGSRLRHDSIAWCLANFVLLFWITAPCAAEPAAPEPELATDRPDFTETSVVVPRGRLQLEAGSTYTRSKTGEHVWNLPETLLRLGVGPRWELRLEVPDYISARNGADLDGFSDIAIGAKYQLRPSDARVTMALIPMLSLPTGKRDLTSHRVDPSLAFAWATDLSSSRSLAGLIGLAWPTEDGSRNFTLTTTLSYGFSLGPRTAMFLEAFADFPDHGADLPGLHTGVTHLLQPHLQLDMHGGVGLSGAGPDYFLGAGFGVRY
jgi:hypothetical protein